MVKSVIVRVLENNGENFQISDGVVVVTNKQVLKGVIDKIYDDYVMLETFVGKELIVIKEIKNIIKWNKRGV